METFRLLTRRPWGIIGAVVLLAVIAAAILAPVLTNYGPDQIDLRQMSQPPGGDHILGTDNLGRDVFSLLLYGSRPYIIASLTAIGMAIVLGALLGIVSARIGGKTDKILRWVVLAFPILVGLVIILLPVYHLCRVHSLDFTSFSPAIILGTTSPTGFLVIYIPLFISLVFIPSVYNVVRNAASSRGLVPFSQGLVPLIPLALVTFGLAIGLAVLIISWLSHSGYGVDPGTAEWGSTLSGAGLHYAESAPWITRYTIIAIIATIAAAVLFGQAVHEIWFPRIASPLPTGNNRKS